MTLPNETPIERSINGMFSATVPPVSKGGIPTMKEYSLPGYTPKAFDAMRQMKQTIRVEGDFSFDNGFGDIESSHVCQYWLTFYPPQGGGSNGFIPCEGFQDTIRNILKAQKEPR